MRLNTGAVNADTVREFALKVDSGRQIPLKLKHRGLKPESALRLAFQSERLYKLSYSAYLLMIVAARRTTAKGI